MLRIRAEQYEVFAADARRRFRDKAIRHARTHWPEEAGKLGDEPLAKHVDEVLAKSLEAGWRREADVLRVLNLTLAFESDAAPFLQLGWVDEIVRRHDLAGDERLSRLEEAAHRQLTGPRADAPAGGTPA